MLPPQLDLGQVVPSARRAELLGYDFLAAEEVAPALRRPA
jgi:hypothetical protein